MSPAKKPSPSRNIDELFAQALQRIFYFEESDENQSVRGFVDWFNKEGYGDLKDRTFYDAVAGKSKPTPTMIVALLNYSNDIELHSLFQADNSVKTAAAATVRTARDMLNSVADALEGDGQ